MVTVLLLCLPLPVLADESSSTNYKVDQTFFGSGGDLENSSTNYKAKTTLGELGVGNSASAQYQAFAGFNTTDAPYLEFVVTGSNIDLGYLSTSQVATANGQFFVRAWQAGGYVVRTEADPPTNTGPSGHHLAPMAGGSSTTNTEQFGMNLVKNTNFCGVGCDLGADAQQDNQFSSGSVATGYNTSGVFKYNKGDIVAEATQSSSVTVYTLSYIFNINGLTPSGEYKFRHILVVTATF